MPRFTDDMQRPDLPGSEFFSRALPQGDLQDFIGRQPLTQMQFSFIPIPNLVSVTGLGGRSKNTFTVPDENGNIVQLDGREAIRSITVVLDALPAVRMLLDRYYKSGQTFEISYEVFGYGNPPPIVDVGAAVDCKVMSMSYEMVSRNSDQPVRLTLEIAIGEWIL
jgi:hypothetical protein